jgi:hypothetical protein
MAPASDRPSLTAASCVGEVACGWSGTTLMSCSRTALECETRMSPGFRSDNDGGFVSFATSQLGPVWQFALFRSGHDRLMYSVRS